MLSSHARHICPKLQAHPRVRRATIFPSVSSVRVSENSFCALANAWGVFSMLCCIVNCNPVCKFWAYIAPFAVFLYIHFLFKNRSWHKSCLEQEITDENYTCEDCRKSNVRVSLICFLIYSIRPLCCRRPICSITIVTLISQQLCFACGEKGPVSIGKCLLLSKNCSSFLSLCSSPWATHY